MSTSLTHNCSNLARIGHPTFQTLMSQDQAACHQTVNCVGDYVVWAQD